MFKNMASLTCCVRIVRMKRVAVKMMFRGMSSSAPPQAQVDFLNGQPHRKHPGVTNLKTLSLPEELQRAAQLIIESSELPKLAERSKNLTNFLWSRKRAVEDTTLRLRGVSLEKELWEKEMMKISGSFDEEALEHRIKRKVFSELRRTTYRWTPMKYNEEFGMVYMAARLAGGYAAVRRALNEIKKRDPSFAPHSLLDFGSGLGTVVWAAHSHWPASLKEMVCVDSSGPMNILAERLLKGDDEKAQPHIKHVYFRQFLPVTPKIQFDLVTAAFTLSELPSAQERQEAVFTLWRKTSSYLVLVENGTKEGHQILMDARDTLLKEREKILHDDRPPSVFAPCTHELTCPKLTRNRMLPCNFTQSYQPLRLTKHNNSMREKFSYLILTRNGSQQEETTGVEWARLIAPVLRRTRHVHCLTCNSNGQSQHVVITARKHTRDVYRCARNSECGDLLPVLPNVEDGDQDVECSDSE